MSTTFDVRRWATQAGIQTAGGFAVIAECVTMDELQRFAEIAIASAGIDAADMATAAAHKAAPGEQLTREQIREVFMAHGFTIKEGQTDLKQYVYDAAHALLGLVAAPQQEAQEPVAWQGVHDQTDLYYTKPLQADVRPLYAAPQPAPDCHHRPPCDECAAYDAQGGK